MSKQWQGSKWIRPAKRAAIYMRDDWKCVYCMKVVEVRFTQSSLKQSLGYDSATLDHVLARELGGTNDHRNLVTCCKACNSAKRASKVSLFMLTLGDLADGAAQRVRNAKRRKLPKPSDATLAVLISKRMEIGS
jgi:hypothetical protein